VCVCFVFVGVFFTPIIPARVLPERVAVLLSVSNVALRIVFLDGRSAVDQPH